MRRHGAAVGEVGEIVGKQSKSGMSSSNSSSSSKSKSSSFTGSTATDQAIAGFTAGSVSAAVLHPLDLIKTRYQGSSEQPVVVVCMQHAACSMRLAAWKASWASWALTGCGPRARALARALDGSGTGSGTGSSQQPAKLAPLQHMAASAGAGLLTCVFTNPLWLIKTRMCTQRATDPGAYRGLYDGLRQVVRHEGVAGLYRGIVPAFIGVSHGALQFMAYEEMKHIRMELVHGADINKLGPFEYITMAAASKVFATVCTYPYQVIKSRMQVQSAYVQNDYTTVLQTTASIFKNEGVRGFYKGMGVNIVRVLPGTCITFGVYEAVSKFLRTSA
ncbi:mitochondrial carrier domain-containing protein [Entophlyctis helioformis]|nr:mitochondrial carrier domain-containing protein [Entophlyctis helioformis]